MNISNDLNATFDRLVDDELSTDERTTLLASLEDQPEGWRRCALAFLEQQSWRRELQSLVGSADEPFTIERAQEPKNFASHRGHGYLAIAAGLLCAFVAGWLVRPDLSQHPENQQFVVDDGQQAVLPDPFEEEPLLDDHDVVTLLVRDDRGQARRVRVPLVELAEDDQQAASVVNLLPDNYRKQLQHRGLDVRGRRRYAPLYFEQNEQVVPMAVPVDDAYIVPVNRPVF